MKTTLAKRPKYAAFTLIEMIGVLAVIAILASLLIPKILNAINDAKINNAVVSYNTIKTHCMEHYGKYGKFAGAGGAALTLPVEQFEITSLLPDNLIDKPWNVKIGDGLFDATHGRIRIFTTAMTAASVVTISDGYSFDGSGTVTNEVAPNSAILEAVITGVPEADAKAYN